MGDLVSALEHLNLSPLVTIILVVAGALLKNIIGRLESIEATLVRHRTSIAIIKNQLEIEEDD